MTKQLFLEFLREGGIKTPFYVGLSLFDSGKVAIGIVLKSHSNLAFCSHLISTTGKQLSISFVVVAPIAGLGYLRSTNHRYEDYNRIRTRCS